VWESLAVAAVLVFSAAFAVLVVKLPQIIWRIRNPPEKIEEQRREYEARLLRPDWQFYERHLLRPVPVALRRLFDQQDILDRLGVMFDLDGAKIYVTGLCPIDEQGLEDARSYFQLDIVPFADSDGDVYFLKPGLNESNAVYEAFFHESNDESGEPIADDATIFVEAIFEHGKMDS
jgi:hypothetical protein